MGEEADDSMERLNELLASSPRCADITGASMSPVMSWAEHLVMVVALSASLAAMMVVVFLAERQSDSRRSHSAEQQSGKHRGLSKRQAP
jgi:fucose permease